jgi:MATE family multidrug resistance protein
MPISFGTGFGLGWGLHGLWLGPAIALFIVFSIEGWWIRKMSWEDAVEAARTRNYMG